MDGDENGQKKPAAFGSWLIIIGLETTIVLYLIDII